MSSHIKMNRRLVQHILFLGAVFMASLAGESFWYRAGPFFQINKHRPIFFSGSNKLDDLFLWFLSDIFMCVAVASSVADIMYRYLICYIFVVGGGNRCVKYPRVASDRAGPSRARPRRPAALPFQSRRQHSLLSQMVQRYRTFSPDLLVYLIRFDSFFSFSSFRWGYCDALNRVAPVRYNQTRALWFSIFDFHFPFWSFRFLSSTTSLIVYCEIAYWTFDFFRLIYRVSRVLPHRSRRISTASLPASFQFDCWRTLRNHFNLFSFSFLFFSYLFWLFLLRLCACVQYVPRRRYLHCL